MNPNQTALEHTYGMQLQTAIITLLLELKEEPNHPEITSILIADRLRNQIPGLSDALINKREKYLFRIRIRKVLAALSKNGQLEKTIKKSATNIPYHSFKINM